MKKTILFFAALFIISVCFADSIFVQNKIFLPDSLYVNTRLLDNKTSTFLEKYNGALIGLTALLLTVIFQYKQQKLQRKITIEKEWVETMRKCISTCLYSSIKVSRYIKHFRGLPNPPQNETDIYEEALQQFNVSSYTLSLYVDYSCRGERELEKMIVELSKQTDTGADDYNLISNIIKLTRQIIKERLHN